MNKRILFIKCGAFSSINKSVLENLKNIFPEYYFEEYDVNEKVTPEYIYSLKNIICFLKEYGFDFLTLKKSRYEISSWLNVTSYMFKVIRKSIQNHVKKNQYIFTFQTQSLFDGSTPGIPHFVYTDSTVLANLFYPDISMKSVLKSKKWMKLEPQIYQNATINFTFSTNQLKSLTQQYNIDPAKVKCVYAGSNIIVNPVENINKTYDIKTLLFVGVNWERKGGPVLLKAFHKVLHKHPDAKLIIVGCNKNSILINNTEEELVNCIITGRIPIDEVKKYYMQATMFCMPTRIEPFGIVFIEAMMHKLPIIASNIGALTDLVTNGVNGFLHKYNDVDGFANAIIKLLDKPELCESMGNEGLKKANQNYTWDYTVRLMKDYIIHSI